MFIEHCPCANDSAIFCQNKPVFLAKQFSDEPFPLKWFIISAFLKNNKLRERPD